MGINAIPGLKIVGIPDMSVFSFTSRKCNIFRIADRMEEKGWRINRQNNPESLHMIVTPNHLQAIDIFLKDLEKSVIKEHENPSNSASDNRSIIYGGKTEGINEKDTIEYLVQSLEETYRL